MTGNTDLQVSKPNHYQGTNGIECIDAICGALSAEEYLGYLRGNIIKYLWRCRKKGNPSQDIAKAEQYISMMKEVLK
jgi:hypothetical protein